ncbi:hypothetical protein BOTBODRAFT_36076 [Botryobasidium botryosum FD-172 SS1]|uniref:PARP catalytic domain-containing protein n=1 Tax=Botryobasidium botryosum (strain FD-172 SS1) TaxID=930990 RepID=A0A067M436_BOTB1|nr:hypothetical protein BOTBODRAFT_36076 [Botryobasidium botryosum FD-172 SS1]
MSETLWHMQPHEDSARSIQNHFYSSWQHPNKKMPTIKHIFGSLYMSSHSHRHLHRSRAYAERYGSLRMLFHGTLRTCRVGDTPGSVDACNSSDCKLCTILHGSFDPSKSYNGMFGYGVYATPVSSKADGYVTSPNSPYKAMLYALVTLGKTKVMNRAEHGIRQAPDSCDSVTAATYAQGGAVEYPEMVVYHEDAICADALIIYEDN